MKLINPEVRIENTSCCNTHCTICPREKMTRPKVFMPTGHFENLVDESKELGAELISIFGYGEPLLDNYIVEKVRYCTDKGLRTFITTNASLLSVDMTFALLDAGLSQIRFSVHGFNESYSDVQKFDFDDIIRKIDNFVAINRGNRFEHKCAVSISCIPMRYEEINLIKYWWSKNDYKLEIWKPHNWTNGRNFRSISTERKRTCGRPETGPVQINADGNMMVCCFDFDARMVMGNTYKRTIEWILKSPNYEVMRAKHRAGDLSGLPCETCDQLNIGDTPLIYSNIDPECKTGLTSSIKFDLEERKNGLLTVENEQLSGACSSCCN